jgi:uncharacterized membrane protein
MSWYELLLSLHILAIATWFGSGLALIAVGFQTIKTGPEVYGGFVVPAARWAGRAHPASGLLLLLTGILMIVDADWDFDAWLILGIIGLVAAMGIGGAFIGRTSDALVKRIERGGITAEELTDGGQKILLFARIEMVILVLVIVDMVAKPGA